MGVWSERPHADTSSTFASLSLSLLLKVEMRSCLIEVSGPSALPGVGPMRQLRQASAIAFFVNRAKVSGGL